jgi:hypothetical protein
MSDHDQGILNDMFGDEAAEKLGAVYGDMLQSLYDKGYQRVPPREVRLVVASALVVEAGNGERDPARLMQAAMTSLDGDLEALRI